MRIRWGLALALASTLACRGHAPGPGTHPGATRQDRDQLRARLDELAATDPRTVEALDAAGDVVVGIRPALAEDVLQEVAARYFDRVVLDLELEARVEERGQVDVDAVLGKLRAGVWTLELVVHRVSGVLRLRTLRLDRAEANRLSLKAPVVLEEAQGTATARFQWNAGTLAGAVCRDFEVTRKLRGRALANEYQMTGAFQISAGPETLRVQPDFPPQKFRIRVDLAPESWGEIKNAIEGQDRILKCGLALDPAKLLEKIGTVLRKGFDVKIPQSLFRSVDFPASVRRAVTVEEREVNLAVRTSGLRITPLALWYSAEVRSALSSK